MFLPEFNAQSWNAIIIFVEKHQTKKKKERKEKKKNRNI